MISICVAVYREHGEPNIGSLQRELPAALGPRSGELVVALNGISAAAVHLAEGTRAIDLGINRGVAPAWNAAASAARGRILVFCNDDVQLGAGSLARLAEAVENLPHVGVVGPLGSRWDIAAGKHLDWVRPREPSEALVCDVVSGFLFACFRETWEAVGGFDEAYAPASWEEVDFCCAVRARGKLCYAVGGVDYWHEWGVSRRQLPWARAHWDGRSETWRSIHRRNRRRFLNKWTNFVPASSLEARADAEGEQG